MAGPKAAESEGELLIPLSAEDSAAVARIEPGLLLANRWRSARPGARDPSGLGGQPSRIGCIESVSRRSEGIDVEGQPTFVGFCAEGIDIEGLSVSLWGIRRDFRAARGSAQLYDDRR